MGQKKIIDQWCGAELLPGDPEHCQGNGKDPRFELCCDECDHFLKCFPEWDEDSKTFRNALIEARLRKSAEMIAKTEGVTVREMPFEEFMAKVMARKEKRDRRMKMLKDFNFRDEEHAERFDLVLDRMNSEDCYHVSMAYLLALDDNLTHGRINRCFDFENDSILPAVLEEDWITGTDRRILTLAFALWNNANRADINDVFGYSETEYLIEAVWIRFRN